MLVEMAAIVAAVLLVAVAAFQVTLTLGAPFGAMTMGGRARTVGGVLTPPYRIAAGLSAVVLVISAWLVLARAGIATLPLLDDEAVGWATWAIEAFTVLNSVTNLSGSHPVERYGMTAVTVICAVCIAYVAVAG
jgi:hypothetical protein